MYIVVIDIVFSETHFVISLNLERKYNHLNYCSRITLLTQQFFKICAIDNKNEAQNWCPFIIWYSSFYFLIYTTYNRHFNIKLFSCVNHYIHLIKYK